MQLMASDLKNRRNLAKSFYFTCALLFFLSPISISAQSYNLQIGNALLNCNQYAEVPIVFTQPDVSSAVSVILNISFSSDIFQEQYFSPNQDQNRPQIMRGAALAGGVGASFSMISFQLAPGAWRIAILAPGGAPATAVPQGEIVRIRFYAREAAPPSVYPLSFSSVGLFGASGNTLQPVTQQNGLITLFSCNPTTTLVTTSTTTSIIGTTSTVSTSSTTSSTVTHPWASG